MTKIGVALGSGGARGLAHIPFIEAMDELGVKPALIAGTSIGALLGAGWAAGMTGAELRDHTTRVTEWREAAGRLWQSSRPTFKDIREGGLSMQVDARKIVDAYLPEPFPLDFAALPIPLRVVATDLGRWEPRVFSTGPLKPAIAASFSIPMAFRPVPIDGALYLDGGTVDPLPISSASEGMDLVIAIDVNGLPGDPDSVVAGSAIEEGFAATQILTHSIIRLTLALHPPDIYIHAPVDGVRVFEFWRAPEILAAAETVKDDFKRRVTAALDAKSAGENRVD